MALLGTVMFGDFQVIRTLVQSDAETVFEVEQRSTGKRRALKRLRVALQDDAARARFVDAARAAGRIESEHVAELVAFGVDEETGEPWIVTELLEGKDLRALVAERGPLPHGEALEVLAQVAHGLSAAHAAGGSHGAVSPNAVFVATSKRQGAPFTVKLLDAGIAPVLGGATADLAPGVAGDLRGFGRLALFALTAHAGPDAAGLVATPLPSGFDEWLGRCEARGGAAPFAGVREAHAALVTLLSAPVAPSAPPPRSAPPPVAPALAPLPFPAPYAAGPSFEGSRGSGSGAAVGVLIAVIVALLLVVAVAGAGAVYWLRRPAPVARPVPARPAKPVAPVSPRWSDVASPVPVTSDDPTWGDRDAPVTLVVFSDFQCPFCTKLETALTEVRETYGEHKVRIVWKNYPLASHAQARPAAEAGRGVFVLGGNAAFWTFHAEAFRAGGALSTSDLERFAAAAGVSDDAVFRSGLSAHTWRRKVDDDVALGGRLGVTGTPTSFVNGVRVTGAQPFASLQGTIDAELVKAEDRIARGTARDRVYVAMSAANYVAPSKPLSPGDDDGGRVFQVPVAGSPTKGPAAAPVTIVAFSDFQCPFCARVEPTLTQLFDKYGAKVRLVWKNMPLAFHTRAEPAAQFALEARKQRGDAGFWLAHDKLFANAKALSDEDLSRYAEELRLDVARVKAAVGDHLHKSSIDADAALAKSVGATGTPTFFINGRRLSGAQPPARFEELIDEELRHAGALVARGVPAAAVYDTILKEGTALGPSLAIHDDRVGAGPEAKAGDKVRVHYTGTLSSGAQFDSSRDRGAPFSFTVGAGHVIAGWERGVPGMRVGGIRTLTVPPSLGYGERGHPPTIPPNATLTFRIELVAID